MGDVSITDLSGVHVECWTEWGRLRHVIVGVADKSQIPPPEPAYASRLAPDSDLWNAAGPRSVEAVAEANEQLDNFARMLRARGIRVDRPTPIDFGEPVRTPDFTQRAMFGCMAPRDVITTIGREILEANMSFRSRYFEFLSYRPLIEEYFRQDLGMRHECVPKARLTAASFREEFHKGLSPAAKKKLVRQKKFVTTDIEPIIEAADCVRVGRDLFWQHGFTTNARGIDWLRRHFGSMRVHALNFPGDAYPAHIDCTFLPLRPGFVLINPDRPPLPDQIEIFRVNEWRLVEAARPRHEKSPPLCYSSPWLSMNVLSVDEKTVCVEASEAGQMEQLDSLGFEVLPVPLRKAYPFGGGLHCATTDIWREGGLQDFFPRQR
jgi:glycine amidinotransferase